jgi:3-hydroxy-9,10-secoandrosta-1,3,5(10)-triene-9,17-dione monooxygenase
VEPAPTRRDSRANNHSHTLKQHQHNRRRSTPKKLEPNPTPPRTIGARSGSRALQGWAAPWQRALIVRRPSVGGPTLRLEYGYSQFCGAKQVGDMTQARYMDRAEALVPLLRSHAASAEDHRRISSIVIDEFAASGILGLLTRKRFGGAESNLRTLAEVAEKLGEGDGSAAWVAVILAVNNWLTSLFPLAAQEDVFAADPNVGVTGAAAPTGTGRSVEGGWRVTGSWSYSSGMGHASWALLGTLLMDDTGQVADQALLLVPVSDLTAEDTWFTAGMRATDSGTLVGVDVFVPGHRVLSVPAALEGMIPGDAGERGLYRSGFVPMLSLSLVAPILGIGNAALALVTEKALAKPLSFTVHERQANSVGFQLQVAEAAMKLETARLHVYAGIDEVDASAARGMPLGYPKRAHLRAQAGYAAQEVIDALSILLSAHGAASFAASNPLQRMWRDANTAARHAGLVRAVGLEVLGKALLGVEAPVSLMV